MELNGYIDHTNLKPDATKDDIIKLCEEAKAYHFATVAVNSCWTALCAEQLKGSAVGITTCIGFPLGAASTDAKVAETIAAVADGTTEIDMVINLGLLKSGDDNSVAYDIECVVDAARGCPVKVIIECCLLDDKEIIRACQICVLAGASFVKTSTGFSTGGAKAEDVRLMKRVVDGRAKIKAAGGIHNRQEALEMIEAGADRIGASCGIDIVAGK